MTSTAPIPAQIAVNGEFRPLTAPTVAALIAQLNLDSRKVAIELNRAIVPRSAYASTALSPGDAVEIVGFIGGG